MWAASQPTRLLRVAGAMQQNSAEQKPLPTLAATRIPEISGRQHSPPARTALASAGLGELWAAVAQKGCSTKVRQRDVLARLVRARQNSPEDSSPGQLIPAAETVF